MQRDDKRGCVFHLLIEDFNCWNLKKEAIPSDGAVPSLSDCLEIPHGVGFLLVESCRPPRIVKRNRVNLDNLFIIQPLWNYPRPHLLLFSPGREPPIINGFPAPPVALLKMRDEVMFCNSSAYVAHVTLFIRPQIGPPPDHRIGKKCPVCKTEFHPDSMTYTCQFCGQILHSQKEGHSNAEDLNCANFCRNCPICETPIQHKDGYAYFPDFIRAHG
jgi:hypothetical protein